MVKIPHTLKFETELDETNPTAARLLSLPYESQVEMLENMLKAIIVPKITAVIDEVNDGNSWAILKVAE